MGDWKLNEPDTPAGFKWEYAFKTGEVNFGPYGICTVANYRTKDGYTKNVSTHPNFIDGENAHCVHRRLVSEWENIINDDESPVLQRRAIDAEIERLEKLKTSIK